MQQYIVKTESTGAETDQYSLGEMWGNSSETLSGGKSSWDCETFAQDQQQCYCFH